MSETTDETAPARGPALVELPGVWLAVMTTPRRFFGEGLVPGKQSPGLVFAVVVTLLHVGTRFALAPAEVPVIAGDRTLSLVFALLATAVVIAPLGLHLTSALQTVALILAVPDRAGVSKTVQVVGYSAAPLAVAGVPFQPTVLTDALPALATVPFAGLRLAACLYAFALLVVGLATVHETSLGRALVAGVVPGSLAFGYGFGGIAAFTALTGITVGTVPVAAFVAV